jgi:pimeloyl-ACP methyl ester carboxylesterase
VESGSWHVDVRVAARLCCLERRGPGPAVVLVHGLAGYAEEWAGTASWLSEHFRVAAVEQRGHGRSERSPADVTPEAFVADAEMWIERLCLAPAVVVGQSFGGLVALLLAAWRPELVRGLVVVEASPAADPDAPEAVGRWLASWPVPFATREDALSYFGGNTDWSRAWAGGLEERGDGLWPAFEPEVLLAALAAASERSWWDDWARIRCPALVAYGEQGGFRAKTRRMVEELAGARAVEIADAGHDLHLEQPLLWREALEAFLDALDR